MDYSKAIAVKLCDMLYNSMLERFDNPTKSQIQLTNRYKKRFNLLFNSLFGKDSKDILFWVYNVEELITDDAIDKMVKLSKEE